MLSLHPMSKSGQCRRRATQEQPSAARTPRSIGARTIKIDWHAALTPSHPLASRLCCKIGVMGIGKVQTGIAKREFGRRARKTAGLGASGCPVDSLFLPRMDFAVVPPPPPFIHLFIPILLTQG